MNPILDLQKANIPEGMREAQQGPGPTSQGGGGGGGGGSSLPSSSFSIFNGNSSLSIACS
ncbi:hypothetical protein GCM10010896_00450 [Mammaliicoccus stepanovicii]|uniref:Uncharacterized protein n=1 Tax=Mammaliicoccus stepanovicii TaxID=643214 RepID=A0A239ZTH6_9STAP|nr:hypothetical protein [Mammaliicoccus stepanovicii]GGI38851.1 hypothetical protein GCM10010896_00450 [Mammaliicoccus stepanovicii]SNV74114.1 Uncharacterised protein [Mammaliicoccus stepanovicii]